MLCETFFFVGLWQHSKVFKSTTPEVFGSIHITISSHIMNLWVFFANWHIPCAEKHQKTLVFPFAEHRLPTSNTPTERQVALWLAQSALHGVCWATIRGESEVLGHWAFGREEVIGCKISRVEQVHKLKGRNPCGWSSGRVCCVYWVWTKRLITEEENKKTTWGPPPLRP